MCLYYVLSLFLVIFTDDTQCAPSTLAPINNNTIGNISTTMYISTTMQAFDEYLTSFNKNNVICSANSNCYVECVGKYKCQSITVYAENSNNLYLTCLGQESCGEITVFAPNNGDITINCNFTNSSYEHHNVFKEGACDNIELYANNANNVDIECEAEYDCYSGDFRVNNAQNVNIRFNGYRSGYQTFIRAINVTNIANITCIGYDACYQSDYFCPIDTNSKCIANCYGDRSCARMRFTIIDTFYSQLFIYCKHNISDCFTENNIGSAYITCSDSSIPTKIEYNKYLSNEVSCDSSSCCPFTFEMIQCIETECIINCDQVLCDGHIINGTHSNLLEILCIDNDINSTCNGLSILCPNNGDCNLECNIFDGCKNVVIRENIINGINTNIQLLCLNKFSCQNMMIYGSNANSIIINATNFYGLFLSEIHAENAKQFELICKNSNDGEWDKQSCRENKFYLSSDNVSIDCWGNSCFESDYYLQNGWSININLNIFSYCQCDKDIIDCIESWNNRILCGDNYNLQQFISSNNCTECGCNDLLSSINYINNDYTINRCSNITTTDINIAVSNNTLIHDPFDNDNDNKKNKKNKLTIGGITGIIVAILSILGIIYFGFYFYKQKMKIINNSTTIAINTRNNNNNDENTKQIEMQPMDDNKDKVPSASITTSSQKLT